MVDTAVAGLPQETPKILRVAVGSSDGQSVNEHFGSVQEFIIFDVTADGARLVERRAIADHALEAEKDNPRATICRMLADCKVLLVAKVGAGPQELLARHGIEATDRFNGVPIEKALLEVLAAKTAAPRA